MLRFDDHSKFKPTEGFGIPGNLVDVTLVKSRTNAAGRFATLVFDQDNGFDEQLSLFYLLKDNGRFNGSGAYLYLGDRDDIKFSQKTFKTKLEANEDLQQLFMNEVVSTLKAILDTHEETVEREQSTLSLTSNILNMLNTEVA